MTARFQYSSARTPPIPAVTLAVASPDGSAVVPKVSAHIDTAADRTVLPLVVVRQLRLPVAGQLAAIGFGGLVHAMQLYRVRIEIPGVGR
jgi:hypothetical protein